MCFFAAAPLALSTAAAATPALLAPLGAGLTSAGVAASAGASAFTFANIASAASLALGAGGLFLQVGAQRAQAQAASNRAQFEAAVARNNMILANRLAEDAIKRGGVAEKQQRLKTRQLIGQQRAGFAAHGVVVDEGTAQEVTEDTAAFGELDALTIRNNAEREALGFRTQGMNFQASGELAQLRAFQPDTTFGTVLTGSAALLDRFTRLRAATGRRT